MKKGGGEPTIVRHNETFTAAINDAIADIGEIWAQTLFHGTRNNETFKHLDRTLMIYQRSKKPLPPPSPSFVPRLLTNNEINYWILRLNRNTFRSKKTSLDHHRAKAMWWKKRRNGRRCTRITMRPSKSWSLSMCSKPVQTDNDDDDTVENPQLSVCPIEIT